MDAQLSLVSQHPIGPFPRVQSPTRLKSPSPDSAAAGGLQSPPSPSPPPPPPHPAPPPPDKGSPQAVANQHFIMVEVHQPNSEPDVNEVRPLPQARGGCRVMNHRMKKPSPGCSSREKTEAADMEGRNWGGSWKTPPSGYRSLPEHQPCLQSVPFPSRDVRWQPWRGHGGKHCDFGSNSKSIGQGKSHRAWIDVMVGSRVFICFFFSPWDEFSVAENSLTASWLKKKTEEVKIQETHKAFRSGAVLISETKPSALGFGNAGKPAEPRAASSSPSASSSLCKASLGSQRNSG